MTDAMLSDLQMLRICLDAKRIADNKVHEATLQVLKSLEKSVQETRKPRAVQQAHSPTVAERVASCLRQSKKGMTREALLRALPEDPRKTVVDMLGRGVRRNLWEKHGDVYKLNTTP